MSCRKLRRFKCHSFLTPFISPSGPTCANASSVPAKPAPPCRSPCLPCDGPPAHPSAARQPRLQRAPTCIRRTLTNRPLAERNAHLPNERQAPSKSAQQTDSRRNHGPVSDRNMKGDDMLGFMCKWYTIAAVVLSRADPSESPSRHTISKLYPRNLIICRADKEFKRPFAFETAKSQLSMSCGEAVPISSHVVAFADTPAAAQGLNETLDPRQILFTFFR